MNKVFLTTAPNSSFEKDLAHLEASTNFTDVEDSHNADHNELRIPLIPCLDSSKQEDEKSIQRTNSLSVMKPNSDNVMFEFFGKSLTVDSSDKI